MATIDTTTDTTPLYYPGSIKISRSSTTGHLWEIHRSASGSNVFDVFRSTNNGTSWSVKTTYTRANVQEVGSIFLDNFGWLHIVYRTNESSQDRIYHNRYNINEDWWDDELAYHNPSNGGVAGSVFTGCDVCVIRYSGWDWVVVAAGYTSGGSQGVYVASGTINTSNNVELLDNSKIKPKRVWTFSGSGRSTPSIGLDTSGTKHMWVAFGNTNAGLVKLAWNGNGWTASSQVTLGTGLTTQSSLAGRFDGSRMLVAAPNPDALALDTVVVYERNNANTSTTKRVSPAHPTGVVKNCSIAYYGTTGDFRVYAIGTSTTVLYYIGYTRATDTWGSWNQVVATAILGTNGENYSVRNSANGSGKYDIIACHSGAPNTIVNYQQGLAFPPNTPTWNGATGISGAAKDVAASLLLDWDFTDPDPSDTQSAYAVSRQIGAGALNYWRASDSTWQVAEVQNTSGTSQITLPSSWGADGDAVYTFKVKVWDQASTQSGYSAGFVVIPSAKDNPTITTPTAGGSISTNMVTATWTVATQTAFRVVLVPNPNPDNVTYHDSGFVTSSALSYQVPVILDDLTSWTLKLTTLNDEGLASTEQTVNFTTDFIEPSLPTMTATPMPALGVNRIVCANAVGGPSTFIGAGTAVAAAQGSLTPTPHASTAHEDLMVLVASTRNSGTGTVNTPTGWALAGDGSNFRVFTKYWRTGDANNNPTVTYTSGAANEDTQAQIATWRGASNKVTAVQTLLNASAQNIAYPALTVVINGQLIIVAGWKQDDWTSVATAGFTGAAEIGEPVSTAGNDSGLVWDYAIQTTAANIGASSFTVTGGVSAISRGISMSLDVKPATVYNDIYRRVVGATDSGIRIATGIAPNGTYDDYTAVSGVNYEYRVQAFGANDTNIFGAWTQ